MGKVSQRLSLFAPSLLEETQSWAIISLHNQLLHLRSNKEIFNSILNHNKSTSGEVCSLCYNFSLEQISLTALFWIFSPWDEHRIEFQDGAKSKEDYDTADCECSGLMNMIMVPTVLCSYSACHCLHFKRR